MLRLRPGNLLISQPFLGDPNFERSVVLLCAHSDTEGSFGLVLNQPANVQLSDVLTLPGGEALPAAATPLGLGGPVEPDTLHFLHQRPELPNAVELGGGVYWGGDFARLLELLISGEVAPEDVRLFVGYSGWAAGQLAAELGENVWIVEPNAAAKVFTLTTDAFWQAILREKGGRYRMLSNYPTDPRLN
ncbi:YqgE/AlgH family protein [Hymenobacter aerophilus]|uniref:YqgE/AlgH family protein n=1 Tax=Hymenobacter aerophilus TaxID=119644 RepID=UPI00036B4CFD|nr:YqgE/AlgH family protein [Hymenobacter aerophilus]